jgi:hypothetical protein
MAEKIVELVKDLPAAAGAAVSGPLGITNVNFPFL